MMKFGGSLARNIDFEVAHFRLLVKTRGKTSICELQIVKVEGSLARMLVLKLQLSGVSAFAVSTGEGDVFHRFPMCSPVKFEGNLARNEHV